MSDDLTNSHSTSFTGKHMLACMIAFFGVIITVNLTMAFLANGTWTGLVVKNTYVASQQFNGELLEAKQQRNIGLHSRVMIDDGRLIVRFTSKAATNSHIEYATIWIGRPASEHLDHTLTLTCNAAAQCETPVNLASGLWSFKLQAQVDGNPYRRDIRVEVGSDGPIRID